MRKAKIHRNRTEGIQNIRSAQTFPLSISLLNIGKEKAAIIGRRKRQSLGASLKE
jgi:hypothetical protein